jgi:hypothetical protein
MWRWWANGQHTTDRAAVASAANQIIICCKISHYSLPGRPRPSADSLSPSSLLLALMDLTDRHRGCQIGTGSACQMWTGSACVGIRIPQPSIWLCMFQELFGFCTECLNALDAQTMCLFAACTCDLELPRFANLSRSMPTWLGKQQLQFCMLMWVDNSQVRRMEVFDAGCRSPCMCSV